MQDKRGMAYPPDEISFLDIVSFLIQYWKIVATTLVGGLALAAIYLAVTPKQFDAQGLVKVSQVMPLPFSIRPNADNVGEYGKVFSINLEQPPVLAEQFRQPTAFTVETLQACDVANGEALLPRVQVTPSRTASNVLELSVRGGTPDIAGRCATALFKQLKKQQELQLQPYKADLTEIRKDIDSRYRENQDLVEKMEKAGILQGIYLARRDNAVLLRQQLELVDRAIAYESTPRLLAPIYVSSRQVYPVRSKTMVFGAMIGLMLGLLLSIIHLSYCKWRTRNQPT